LEVEERRRRKKRKRKNGGREVEGEKNAEFDFSSAFVSLFLSFYRLSFLEGDPEKVSKLHKRDQRQQSTRRGQEEALFSSLDGIRRFGTRGSKFF
jgi:hypothetical protein